MAIGKRAAKRALEELMMIVSRHKAYLEAHRNSGDASAVARSKRVLKYDYSRIREHCAEHGLDVPHDMPPAGKG